MSFPRVHPRPDYGPFLPVLTRAVVRMTTEAAKFTLIAQLTAPMYAFAYNEIIGGSGTAPLHAKLLPSWVSMDDKWFAIGLSFAVTFTYVLYNGTFFVLDSYKLLQKYKLPRKPSQEPSSELIWTTLKKELFAHTVTAPIIMVLLAGPLLRHTGGGHDAAVLPSSIPSASKMWPTFLVVFLLNESMFYCGHRLLHQPSLYAIIHKQHHSYKGTRSFAAEYAHVVEDVLTAYIPYLAGLVLMGAHYHVVFIWFLYRLTETYEAHSGYCLKGSYLDKLGLSHWRSAIHHDHHHTANLGNFGSEFMDYIGGTMDHFIAAGGAEAYVKKGG